MSHCRGFLFLYLSYDLTFLNDERMERLFDFEETNIFGPPACPGVYAVCINHYDRSHKERILYIGSSKNVSERLHNRSHPYLKCYDRFSEFLVYTKTIETEEYEQLEKELIGVYRPLLNKQGK